jgi:hypothetical protein
MYAQASQSSTPIQRRRQVRRQVGKQAGSAPPVQGRCLHTTPPRAPTSHSPATHPDPAKPNEHVLVGGVGLSANRLASNAREVLSEVHVVLVAARTPSAHANPKSETHVFADQ